MKIRITEKMLHLFADAFVFACIYAFLLSVFKPSLLLSGTVTAGGDTASHYLPAKYMMEHLMPNGRLMGWFPGWYAGMPLFQNYFIPPFALIALLGYVIGLPVAFKLVTVLGVFALPVAAYLCLRLMGFGFPGPSFAASFTLLFLFMENQSMWGGNIPSTLAGEFSYSISLALTVLFFGMLYRGLKDGTGMAKNTVLLALIAMTHAYTVLWVVAATPAFVVSKSLSEIRRRAVLVGKSYSTAFLLCGFWIIPLLARTQYTTAYALRWHLFEERLPPIFWPAAFLAVFAVLYGVVKRDGRFMALTWAGLSTVALFHMAYPLDLVDIRFVPFAYVICTLLASALLSEISRKLHGTWVLAFVVVLSCVFWASSSQAIVVKEPRVSSQQAKGISNWILPDKYDLRTEQVAPHLMAWNYTGFIPFWVQWNYEGFENKPLWGQYRRVNDFLKGGVSDPRAQFEHHRLHDEAGSVRAFESIPLFAGRSIIEGLYIHSITTSPFAFYLQSEFSQQQSCPFYAKYPCTVLDLDSATEHFKLFNTRYIVVRSDTLKLALAENDQWERAFEADPYEVWELKTNRNRYVYVPENMPIIFQTDDWKGLSYEWFKMGGMANKPIILTSSAGEADSALFKVVGKASAKDLDTQIWGPLPGGCNVSENISSEEIRFTTDCVGVPHVISVSYYPSWSVTGADKIYMVSPSFMLVVPSGNDVTITYGKQPIDWVGIAASVSGLALLYLMWFRKRAS